MRLLISTHKHLPSNKNFKIPSKKNLLQVHQSKKIVDCYRPLSLVKVFLLPSLLLDTGLFMKKSWQRFIYFLFKWALKQPAILVERKKFLLNKIYIYAWEKCLGSRPKILNTMMWVFPSSVYHKMLNTVKIYIL